MVAQRALCWWRTCARECRGAPRRVLTRASALRRVWPQSYDVNAWFADELGLRSWGAEDAHIYSYGADGGDNFGHTYVSDGWTRSL